MVIIYFFHYFYILILNLKSLNLIVLIKNTKNLLNLQDINCIKFKSRNLLPSQYRTINLYKSKFENLMFSNIC